MNFEKQSTFKNRSNYFALAVVVVFVGLFHKASIGLNLGLFTISVLLAFVAQFPPRFKEKVVLANSVAVVVSACSAAYFGTWETVLWCFLSLAIMSHLLYFPGKSLLFLEVKLLYNIMASPSAWFQAQKDPILETGEEHTTKEMQPSHHRLSKVLLVVILPVVLVVVFVGFYRTLNPIFDVKAGQFFEFLDFSMVLTAIIGALVALYFFFPGYPSDLHALTEKWQDEFTKPDNPTMTPKQRTYYQSGIAIFAALNLTLLLFIITDFSFVNTLATATGINYSAYVHGGVDMLIVSILIASGLVLYFFKDAQVALAKANNPLKIMALTWLFLNIVLIGTTALKNFIYIDNQGLTLKRVGVYIYLALACSGLVLVFIKVALMKTNAYLFRRLYVTFYVLLTLNVPIDWSSIITKNNIARNASGAIKLDYVYLLHLDARVLPLFAENWDQLKLSPNKRDHFESTYTARTQDLLQEKTTWRDVVLARKQAQQRLLAGTNPQSAVNQQP
jgi:hypothetical protein